MPPYDPRPHLHWAEQRLIDLERQVGLFVHNSITEQCVYTSDGRHLGHRFTHDPLPPGFSFQSSELINHYRSALDHAVYALSTESKGAPLDSAESLACYFPVVDNRALSRKDERAIRWLKPPVREFIRGEQPHLHPSSVLLLLHQLWNHGKHREIQVAAGGVVDWIGKDQPAWWPGEVVIEARSPDGRPCPAGFTETVTVTFGPGSVATGYPLVRTVAYAGGLVRGIIDDLIRLSRT